MSLNVRSCLAMGAITLASLSLTGCFTEEIDARQTREIQGLLYKVHADDPFSGRVLNYPMSVLGLFNVGTCTVDIEKGLPDGEIHCSDNAGNLLASGEFKAGKRDGKEEKFDAKTGKKILIAHWKNGAQDGVTEQFNPQNGERILEVHYTAGKKNGAERAWDNEGDALIADLKWENGLRSGFDNRGTQHRTYLNGKQHGPQKDYGLTGNRFYVSDEENYENGLQHGAQRRIDARGNVTESSVFEHGKLRTRVVDQYSYDGKHIHHVSRVALKEDVNQYMASDLANDGTEQYWDDNGHLIRELEWNKGKLISATATVWVGDRQESQFQGLGRDNYDQQQRVVKQGQERLFSDKGELQAIIVWNAGQVSQVLVTLTPDLRQQHPGKMGLLGGFQQWANPVREEEAFDKNSTYVGAGFVSRYEQLVDIPAPGQAIVTTPPQATVATNSGNSTRDRESCVQRQVDAVHAEDPEALIRADMLEEFEQSCL